MKRKGGALLFTFLIIFVGLTLFSLYVGNVFMTLVFLMVEHYLLYLWLSYRHTPFLSKVNEETIVWVFKDHNLDGYEPLEVVAKLGELKDLKTKLDYILVSLVKTNAMYLYYPLTYDLVPKIFSVNTLLFKEFRSYIKALMNNVDKHIKDIEARIQTYEEMR